MKTEVSSHSRLASTAPSTFLFLHLHLSNSPEPRGPHLPAMGGGVLGAPGCLTSADEERETWTARCLRVSNGWKLRFSSIETGRKTSAVHVYIGYTIVVRDVNRVQ